MAFEVSSVPHDISTSAAALWGDLKTEIGPNFDTVDANFAILEQSSQLQALNAFGPAVLPGTPASYLTGAGTATWTLASGTVACIPKGTFGSYTGAVVVKTTSALTQGVTGDAINYVWLRILADGTCDLVVNGSSSPPDDCVLVGYATGGATIGSITQMPIVSRAVHRPLVLTFAAFTANSTVLSLEILPLSRAYMGTVQQIDMVWNTADGNAPSDADGVMTVQVYKRTAAGVEKALLASAQSVESGVLTVVSPALTATTADLTFAKGDMLYAKATNDSAAIDNNTSNVTVIVHIADEGGKY